MQHHLKDLLFKDGVYDPGKRSRLSPTQKTDIWKRWKAGETLHEIGRAHGRPHPTIRKLLLPSGGIAPAPRRRSRSALALAEREDISRGIASGSSISRLIQEKYHGTVEHGLCHLEATDHSTGIRLHEFVSGFG